MLLPYATAVTASNAVLKFLMGMVNNTSRLEFCDVDSASFDVDSATFSNMS